MLRMREAFCTTELPMVAMVLPTPKTAAASVAAALVAIFGATEAATFVPVALATAEPAALL